MSSEMIYNMIMQQVCMSVYNHIDHFLQRLVGKNKDLLRKVGYRALPLKRKRNTATVGVPFVFHIPSILVFQSCYNKRHRLCDLKLWKLLTVLEAKSPRRRRWPSWCPQRSLPLVYRRPPPVHLQRPFSSVRIHHQRPIVVFLQGHQ